MTDPGIARRAERLYLVRHGRTQLSARGAYSGRRDAPLTEEGREQARQVAERLQGTGVDAVYSSPLSRAADTARAIAEATGAPLLVDERLTEVDYGPIEGFDRQTARERFSEAFQAWRDDPFGAPLAGMEPLPEAFARARDATSEAIATARCPVIVGHQGILRLVLVALGGIDASEYFTTRFEEAAPLLIDSPSVAQPPARGPRPPDLQS